MRPLLVLLVGLLLSFLTVQAQTVYYVDGVAGTDTPGDGTSLFPWRTVSYALGQVSGSMASPVELRVAEATYTGTIAMELWVDLLGGYEGAGWTRNPALYPSILDGVGADHVVICADNAVLDGFTITGGVADGSGDDIYGAGVFCDGTSPTLRNNVIGGNVASRGGGIFARDSAIQLIDNTIVDNEATSGSLGGGGLYLSGAFPGTPRIEGNLFLNNTAWFSAAIGLASSSSTPRYEIHGNRFAGNGHPFDPSGGNAVQIGLSASGELVNNEFIGNTGVQFFISGGGGTHDVVNNTFRGTSGEALKSYAEASVVNNIFTEIGTAVHEANVANDVTPLNSLFFANTIDFIDEDLTSYSSVTDINLNVAGADANVDGDPLFLAGVSYPWTSNGVYDPGTFTTLLTDSLGISGASSNGYAGWYVNPDTSQDRRYYIVASTSTTLTVLGDASAIALAAETYRVESLELSNGSSAVDRGHLTAPAVPADDIQGDSRPGGDGLIDIGSDEVPAGYAPPADSVAPVSFVTSLAPLQTLLSFDVPYMASDTASGVDHVNLFYRVGTSGSFAQFGGDFTSSPIVFTAAADGIFQFYTVAADNDGNVEAAPATSDAETLVITSFTGSVVYVDQAATGAENGQSWADALEQVDQGLLIAQFFAVPEIWVAQSTYTGSFTLADGVVVYGGFQGTESMLDERDPVLYRTILDGAGADHVVICADNAVLDGFTITGGVADGSGDDIYGAGVFCDGTSPTLRNNVIGGNVASRGGGIFARDSAIQLIDNTIVDNEATSGSLGGGGLYLSGAFPGTPRIEGNLFLNNTAWFSAAIGLASSSSTPRYEIHGNRFAGNGHPFDPSGGNAVQIGLSASGELVNNEFIGNTGVQFFISGGGGTHDVVNNTFRGTSGEALKSYAEASVVNNIFTEIGTAVHEANVANDVTPLNSLFFANTIDFIDEDLTSYSSVTDINLNVAGADANVDGDPLFLAGVSYPWTSNGVYDPGTFTTLLTDSLGISGASSNGYAGWYVNPDTSQDRRYYIVASTSTTLTVLGDASAIALAAETYRVESLELSNGSSAVDRGHLTAPAVPADDIQGDSRPGGDGLIDIGSDEVPAGYAPPADSVAPVSFVTSLAPLQTLLSFDVPYMASDTASGVDHVNLFYRVGTSGSFAQFGGDFTSSPIVFTAAADGIFQFYTVAADNDGNVEAAPATSDAETLVITSFTGSVVYVDQAATGAENGQSWADALEQVDQGLLIAQFFAVPEIWVAQSTYTGSFTLADGVVVYGGFQGTESMLDERDPVLYRTILDGAGADHVVICADNAVLDGFTITGGVADGSGDDIYGAGVFCDGTSPTLRNNVIGGNVASRGGGIFARDSAIQLIDNTIVDNEATSGSLGGGGLYLSGAFPGTPRIEGNLFLNNTAWFSAAIGLASSSSTPRYEIHGNRFAGNGHPFDPSGGNAVQIGLSASGELVNNEFIGNTGVQFFISGGGGTHDVVNNTFRGTSGEALKSYAEASVVNNIFTEIGTAVHEANVANDVTPLNSLFFANTIDFIDEDLTSYSSVTDINLNVAGADANVDGDPLFLAGVSYPWTSNGVYDPGTFTTLLTDSLGISGASSNGYAGWYVNPDTSQDRRYYIVASTSTTLTVLGDASAIALAAETYRVESLRSQTGSGSLDLGTTVFSILPTEDLDGEPRPGPDGLIDIGSDEFDDADADGTSNGLDNCPSVFNPSQANSDGDPMGDICDCDSANGQVWDTPGEVSVLQINMNVAMQTVLSWSAPAESGGLPSVVVYDTLRSTDPPDFVTSVFCLESDDGTDTQAMDTEDPLDGAVFYYLVRADNACPGQEGSLGTDSDGILRPGAACP